MPTIKLDKPSPKQVEFLKDTHKYVAFGGARGGGKSWALRFKMIMLAYKHPGITMMIVRKTYPELQANHIKPLKKILRIGTPQQLARYNEVRKELIFPNGSTILFQYMNSESDVDRVQGLEVDILALDESTQLSEDQIKALIVCVRGANDFPKRVYFTCNPGGKSHGLHKRWFIDRQYIEGEHPEEYSFIKSLVYDNKALLDKDPDYVRQLEALPEALRAAWLEGSWDSFIGQVFREWRNDSEGYDSHRWTHVINPFTIPKSWKIIRGFDHGYSRPFSVLWFAVSHDGVMYLIKEWYGCTSTPNTGLQLTVQEIAQGILDREQSDPNLVGRKIIGIADPAIWGSTTGESIEDMFNKCGVYNSKGDHNRLSGLMQWHYRLAFDQNGYPMFQVFKDCTQFIRTTPLLIYDEHKVEDIDTTLEDHSYDAARYCFMEHLLNPRKNVIRYTESDPLPPDDPLNILTVKETKGW